MTHYEPTITEKRELWDMVHRLRLKKLTHYELDNVHRIKRAIEGNNLDAADVKWLRSLHEKKTNGQKRAT